MDLEKKLILKTLGSKRLTASQISAKTKLSKSELNRALLEMMREGDIFKPTRLCYSRI